MVIRLKLVVIRLKLFIALVLLDFFEPDSGLAVD